MAGVDIQAKVKKGLRRANARTGENPNPINKIDVVLSGGDGITPPTKTETPIQLVDAIFQSYDKKYIDGTTIKAGDRMLVSNSDVEIKMGDIITQGQERYKVVTVDDRTPTGVPLVYKSQLRQE